MTMRIRRLVAEVDKAHHEAMKTIESDPVGVQLDSQDEATASRRRFMRNLSLTGAAAVGSAVVPLTAFAGAAAAQETTKSDEGGAPDPDMATLEFAQGLELALVAVYGLATERRLLDAQELETCRTFESHHKDHAAALAALAGKKHTVTEANAKLTAALSPLVEAAKTGQELLGVLQDIEQNTAATYLTTIGDIDAWWVSASVSTVLPIESQHAAVLGQMIDLPTETWLPVMETTTGAYAQSQFTS